MLKPSLTRLQPLLATQARRRMGVVAGTALLFSLFNSGIDTILPLWATKALGFADYQWAQLRSLRFAGVLVGVILLGALSDRFGQRLLGALSMFCGAVLFLVMSVGGKAGIWIAMPILGALVSTAFVNLNTLTQQVSDARQGVANTIYRSIGAAAGIVAPVLATTLAVLWHGYPPVMRVSAVLLVGAGLLLLRYPGEVTPPPLANMRQEILRLIHGYRIAVAQGELMSFIVISLIWGNVLAGVGAFAAIWFTQDLHMSDQQFGLLCSLAGITAFIFTALAGLYLDRISLRKLHLGVAVLSGCCSLLMGVGYSPLLSAIGFIGFAPLTGMLAGPTSMWVSRAAGAGTQTAAFSVQKITSALAVAVAMVILGWLEALVGIRAIFLYGGVLGVLSGFGFLLLREPPLPAGARRPAPEDHRRQARAAS